MPAWVFERLAACIPDAFLRLTVAGVPLPSSIGTSGADVLLLEARVSVPDDDLAVFHVLASFVRYLEANGRSRRSISTDWKHFLASIVPNGDAAQVALLQFDSMMKAFAADLRLRKRGVTCLREPAKLNPAFN